MERETKKSIRKVIAFLYLSLSLILSGCFLKKVDPSVDSIISIQAFTDMCFYGQKLSRVEITYQKNVDLSNVSTDTYTLIDRGYANPDFAEVTIESVDIDGQVVTLNITQDTEAMEDNTLIYAGDNATGSRLKNPIGASVTELWYRAVDGTIYFGEEDSDKYKANTSGDGYQTRECLELKLWHNNESEANAASLANADGSYNTNGVWLPTIDANYGEDGFQSFEELGVEVATTATDGDQFVKGWAYFPEDFDVNNEEKYPLIISINGYGTSYWKHEDGTHNFGTGIKFDSSAIRWMNNGAIVLNIHDRSHTGGENYKFWIDDYHVIQYFIANYKADPERITLSGNSRGTIAVNTITSTYPDLINTLIINNGSMGTGIAGKQMFEGVWTEDEWMEAANNGISIWAFDGEQDTDNQDTYHTAISYYKKAGWSDEWIAENIRITGFPSELYYYWGETDHSTTKMTYWYFFDEPYSGPDVKIEKGELVYNSKLNVGDTYQLKGILREGTYNKEGFDYVIYGENLRDWVLSRDTETR